MNFGISIDTDISFKTKTAYIHRLSDDLNTFFESKNYGNDIKCLTIGLIIKSAQFDIFYKEKRPKYYHGKNLITLEGATVEVEDALEYSIKPDYSKLISADENAILKYVAQEILRSLHKIDTIKKIKNFDKDSFKKDLESFFRARDLL